MAKRPVSLSVVGWLFVATGIGGMAGHLRAFLHAGPADAAGGHRESVDFAWAEASGALALVGGALLLRGWAWARWLLAAWMGAHVVLSLMHSMEELAVHLVLFTPLLWLLFRGSATAYLRSERAGGP